MTVAIRPAVPADIDDLRAVFRRASLANDGDRIALLAHPEWLVLPDEGVRQGRTRVAVSPTGSVVGFATFLIAGSVMELEDLFVDPPWMRQGIGRALILNVVALAGSRACDRLEVTANPHARAFYESAGFTGDRLVRTELSWGTRMQRSVP